MEGKTVILSVFLITSLVITQIQVEALTCCPTVSARTTFTYCTVSGDIDTCASLSGCQVITTTKCPAGYLNHIPMHSGDARNEYCKVGCISSVCSALTTLQNSDASEIVNGAVHQCTKACSTFCTKGSIMTALKTA